MNDYVPRQLSTYALTVFRHKGEVDGKSVEVDFWDTAGQERFASMHPSYYHRAHACILVFDVTRKVTYTNLQEWVSVHARHSHFVLRPPISFSSLHSACASTKYKKK
jgi:Rab-like protein 2